MPFHLTRWHRSNVDRPRTGGRSQRRISWIGKRLDRVSGMPAGPPYAGDVPAAEPLERIAAC
jgi:hypothetical protein